MSAAVAPCVRAADVNSSADAAGRFNPQPGPLATYLGVEFLKDSTTTVLLEHDGKRYVVDLVARTIREGEPLAAAHVASAAIGLVAAAPAKDPAEGASVFKRNCTMCHGPDGKGIASVRTPNFTDPKVQASLTDQEMLEIITHGKKGTLMPAWGDKLSAEDIRAVQGYVRSLGSAKAPQAAAPAPAEEGAQAKVYEPGDDQIFSLPTGRRLDRHGFYVNFSHRFPFSAAFSGKGRGNILFGLDDFAVPSFGFRYGVTSRFSVSAYRSPSIIGRPIQLMAAYNFLDEHDGRPLNAAVRFSVEGQNDFSRNFTTNFEGIFSRSLTRRAQLYFVPTLSLHTRPLLQNPGNLFDPFPKEPCSSPFAVGTSGGMLLKPCANTFSLGTGAAVDIRPTVALVAEVIPTLVNGRDLGIHRPAYSFGIQKKIWRHAFTFGFSTSPGTTVSQRAGTRATFLGEPTADTPSGLFVGFDLTRQIY
jgi:mono/diheme cytochrome c family protein